MSGALKVVRAGLFDTLPTLRWSMFAGGKRFRPALVLATGTAFGAEIKVLTNW